MAIACAMCCHLCFHVGCTTIRESLPSRSDTKFRQFYLCYSICLQVFHLALGLAYKMEKFRCFLDLLIVSTIFNMGMVFHIAHRMKFSFPLGIQILWTFQVGLPAKSGVSGGLVVVVPNVMGIGLWSPALDEIGKDNFCQKKLLCINVNFYFDLSLGNSVRGLQFCKVNLECGKTKRKLKNLRGENLKLLTTCNLARDIDHSQGYWKALFCSQDVELISN